MNPLIGFEFPILCPEQEYQEQLTQYQFDNELFEIKYIWNIVTFIKPL